VTGQIVRALVGFGFGDNVSGLRSLLPPNKSLPQEIARNLGGRSVEEGVGEHLSRRFKVNG